MFDFPNTPTTGQAASNGTATYRWDGTKWAVSGSSAAGGASITIGDTPPSTPTSGAMWFDSVGAQTYIWYPDPNSAAWVPMNAPPPATTTAFLPLSGGTLTGSLTLSGNATQPLHAVTLQQVPVASTTTPAMNGTAAVGTGTTWARADHVHASDTTKVNKAGDTMTGALTLSFPWTTLALVKPASGSATQIAAYNGANYRWVIQAGDNTAESGGNAGSNFAILRYNDAGTYLDSPFSILRSNGQTVVGNLSGNGFACTGISVNGTAGNPACYPLVDNRGHCGGGAYRWEGVWSVLGSIQTSDPNEKRDIRPLPDDCLPVIDAVRPIRFRWNNGQDPDVTHWGFLATEIRETMQKHGLDFGGVVVPEEGPVGLQATELLAVLWRGVQQLSAEVSELRSRV